jgi:hypothetical protein
MTKNAPPAESNANRRTSATGLRRVRLCFWHLFRRTPLKALIDTTAERAAAEHCKVPWPLYVEWKRTHKAMWWREAAKRVRAIERGKWPEQPWQLRRWRKVEAARMGRLRRRERPRFVEWAWKRQIRLRSYKRVWLRHRELDRLFLRTLGM